MCSSLEKYKTENCEKRGENLDQRQKGSEEEYIRTTAENPDIDSFYLPQKELHHKSEVVFVSLGYMCFCVKTCSK